MPAMSPQLYLLLFRMCFQRRMRSTVVVYVFIYNFGMSNSIKSSEGRGYYYNFIHNLHLGLLVHFCLILLRGHLVLPHVAVHLCVDPAPKAPVYDCGGSK